MGEIQSPSNNRGVDEGTSISTIPVIQHTTAAAVMDVVIIVSVRKTIILGWTSYYVPGIW